LAQFCEQVVSERLGHAKVAFTLDRYGHVLPGMHEKAAVKLEVILFGR
jgi:integrase